MKGKSLYFIISTIIAILSLPIALYVYKFGIGLWDSHADWAVMGSYFGGVLGPLITGVSLLFLGFQIRAQVIQNKIEYLDRKCSHSEVSVRENLPRLSEYLKLEFGDAIRLTKMACKDLIRDGQSDAARDEATKVVRVYFKEFQTWNILDSNLRELCLLDYSRYKKMSLYLLAEQELEVIYDLHFLSDLFSKTSSEQCVLLKQQT
ncbi:hypothetical protein KS868_004427 [Vibrio parahaemolyticus]|nr:hypothetical protein [Vibrio parahaemolyticus]